MPITEAQVREIFKPLEEGNPPAFFENVADNVNWRVTGTQNPLGGDYTSKADFQQKTFGRLGGVLKTKTVLKVVGVIVNDSNQAAVELKADATCKNDLEFANEYCWVCQFDEEGKKIVRVRAYLDSALVKKALDENE
ncbi:hypothetical protein SAICODRAFT_70759 [Saitoella complicata NRRL Y-17804]|uniref:SnoaL-like domain-containing protein n=1 Tax=Saitoella complicata (strain BCRC 22490 / CBS 7301 / JCM 7358 / NBRC 10748 / NRRL Y-17804) TaxID=698492 RepID=A0A0E9NGG1_SAICN|nr:uncharacterized protein SAICODRAFT_70759 [Saitoella complicata NRRL Y-17804]ODQ53613.1 hypothetical protein SAICODRAFT_70759 [Saitoella complicata NRRL Y-17804]GAO48791.1 hypothetical protein G7K_2960-t1 [Saitoella complicata NRRL Y-17804]